MSTAKEERKSVLSYIDAALLITENSATFKLDDFIEDTLNPFDFLLSIIQKKVDKEKVEEWLVNTLIVTLPTIEIGVKGILLSKLKGMIDCNIDPRIPSYMRMTLDGDYVNNNPKDGFAPYRGVVLNLKDIDYKGIMRTSPLSRDGQMFYSSTKSQYEIQCNDEAINGSKFASYNEAKEFVIRNKLYLDNIVDKSEVKTVYELSRATDFNALLWFVTHKGKFTDASEELPDGLDNLLKPQELTGSVEAKLPLPVNVGNSFKQGQNVALCLNCSATPSQISKNNIGDYSNMTALEHEVYGKMQEKTYNAYVCPVSNNIDSVNYYVNNKTFYNFLLPKNKQKIRRLEDERPICNLRYLSDIDASRYGLPSHSDYIHFTILPKPYIHVPEITIDKVEGDDKRKLKLNGEAPWGYQRLLFNEEGIADKNGKYTVNIVGTGRTSSDGTEYDIKNGNGSKVFVSNKSRDYYINNKPSNTDLASVLIPCYPGQTVYEFNYDYVMSMKLFDPVIVARQLLEMVMNVRPSNSSNIVFSKTETMYQMRVAEIVKKVIESTAFETTDCFYSFDNAKYEQMSEEAEMKRAQGFSFSDNQNKISYASADDALNILNEFNDNATLNENKDVFTRAFRSAIASITEEVLPEDKYSLEVNLMIDLIKTLVNIIVETLLSPKVVMLFKINKYLMGDTNFDLSIEDFFKSIEGLLVGIISEIRDLILQELLEWVLTILRDLLAKVKAEIELEQYKYYATLMVLLLKACWFKPKRRNNLDSQLDNVTYADIDPIEQPMIENC